MAERELLFKLIVIGDPAVGKTSLITRIVSRTFQETYLPTLGVDMRVVDRELFGVRLRLVIWDLAGQPRFDTVRRLYFLGSDAAIIVYDVTVRSSFSNVDGWMKAFRRAVPTPVPAILVGNKIDLDEQRKVSWGEGWRCRHQQQLDAFFETSARTGANVMELFDTLNRILLQQRLKDMRDRLAHHIFTAFAS